MVLVHGIGVRIPATQPNPKGSSLADSTGWRMPPPDEQRRILRRLAASPDRAARALLGHTLVRRIGSRVRAFRIVETEAYLGERDPAAHSFKGRTRRTEPLWGPPGTIYVYLIYGIHHCLNLAANPEGTPGCVLIRAAEALNDTHGKQEAGGPGRLTRALSIGRGLSGDQLYRTGSHLWLSEAPPPRAISVSRRIGITKGTNRQLRFFDSESSAVSGR